MRDKRRELKKEIKELRVKRNELKGEKGKNSHAGTVLKTLEDL